MDIHREYEQEVSFTRSLSSSCVYLGTILCCEGCGRISRDLADMECPYCRQARDLLHIMAPLDNGKGAVPPAESEAPA